MWTEAQFDELSWHDCHLWGVELRAGSGAEGDWTSDLALDIDFIVEWLPHQDVGVQFRVAPAALVFHGVTDLSIQIVWKPSGFQVSLHPVSIARIERQLIANQKVYLDRPYYRFRIVSNWPDGGEITFGAVGFTQTLTGQSVVSSEQSLTRGSRGPSFGRPP
jgi:hypothetical protein